MRRKTRIGAIGVGAFMARQHLPNMLRNPNIQIEALCDIDAELLTTRRQEFNPAWVTADENAIFKDPAIDGVLVGTRSNDHARLLIKALESGKHVYVEKPMTMSDAETQSVLDAAKGKSTIVGIGFNRRFAPIMVDAKRKFQSYKNGPANIVYRIVDDHRIRPHYIFNMADGGGHLLQEGCHIFDLLAWFLDAEPVEVYAAGPLETDNIVIVKYHDGSLATILCGGKGGQFYPKELMETFCAARTLVVDHFFETRFDGPGENFIRQYPLGAKNKVELNENTMTGYYREEFASRPPTDIVGPHAANNIPSPTVDKGHEAALTAFADAIVDGKPYPLGVVDGARATVCALRAYQSIRENRPIAIRPEEYGLKDKSDKTR